MALQPTSLLRLLATDRSVAHIIIEYYDEDLARYHNLYIFWRLQHRVIGASQCRYLYLLLTRDPDLMYVCYTLTHEESIWSFRTIGWEEYGNIGWIEDIQHWDSDNVEEESLTGSPSNMELDELPSDELPSGGNIPPEHVEDSLQYMATLNEDQDVTTQLMDQGVDPEEVD